MRLIAVIPARGGSKGVPRKNLAQVGGQSLVARAVHAAAGCATIACTVVSSDDPAILAEGTRTGADIALLRPADLAQDDTPMLPVLQHAVRHVESLGQTVDAVVLLQPTTPTRTADDVTAACDRFAAGNADSLASVIPVPFDHHPEWTFTLDDAGQLHRATAAPDAPFVLPTRRQELPPAWHRDGAIYITRRDVLIDGNSLYGARVLGFARSADNAVNIDTPADLARAHQLFGSATIRIGEREVGPGHPCFIIAEIAQAHDGSLGAAHAYIDAAARAGADAIKFQTHIADAESTAAEPFRVKFSKQDDTRKDYWRRMEFTPAQWAGLAQHAAEKGLVFLSSAFSDAAVDLLENIGMPAWKVASGELTTLPLLRRMAATGAPVILSSGMSSWEDLDAAAETVRAAAPAGITHNNLALLQCTTSYPCPPERIGYNVMNEMRARYGVPVGLSDQSGTVHAGVAAAALGANMLEIHITFSRECFGPDVPASVTTTELADLVRGIRYVEAALASPIDKQAEAVATTSLRETFGKSVVAARALPAGHVLRADDLACKKPGNQGWPAARFDELPGRTLRAALTLDDPLTESNLEPRGD